MYLAIIRPYRREVVPARLEIVFHLYFCPKHQGRHLSFFPIPGRYLAPEEEKKSYARNGSTCVLCAGLDFSIRYRIELFRDDSKLLRIEIVVIIPDFRILYKT